MIEMNRLKFEKMEFNKGVNLTVRRGDLGQKHIGEVFLMDAKDPGFFIKGDVFKMQTEKFNNICPESLWLEHDKVCRDKQGLYETMQRIYPDFQRDEIVTLVYFNVDREQYKELM